MPTRNVVLTDHQASLVERLVRSGRYQNASEVLREGLRLIEAREAEEKARLKALRDAVSIGVADAEAGRFQELESPEDLRPISAPSLKRRSPRRVRGNEHGDAVSSVLASPSDSGSRDGFSRHPAMDC